jgi:hypothetical protein
MRSCSSFSKATPRRPNEATGVFSRSSFRLRRLSRLFHEQITAPPDVGAELAGDVAGQAAGMAAGQIIPFGGQIYGVLSGVVSASSAEGKANAKRTFALRVLKNIELAPAGKVERSAFLPNVTRAKVLVVSYAQEGTTHHFEIPLPLQEP